MGRTRPLRQKDKEYAAFLICFISSQRHFPGSAGMQKMVEQVAVDRISKEHL